MESDEKPTIILPETDGWDEAAKEHPKIRRLHKLFLIVGIFFMLVFTSIFVLYLIYFPKSAYRTLPSGCTIKYIKIIQSDVHFKGNPLNLTLESLCAVDGRTLAQWKFSPCAGQHVHYQIIKYEQETDDHLLEMLKHPDLDVRFRASFFYSIGKGKHDMETMECLIPLFKDRNNKYFLRKYSMLSVGIYGESAVKIVPDLISILENPAEKYINDNIYDDAIVTLGNISPSAVSAITAIVNIYKAGASDPESCRTFVKIGSSDPRVIDCLLKGMEAEHSYDPKFPAAALAHLKPDHPKRKEAIDILIKEIDCRFPTIEFIESLGLYGPAAIDAVPNLKNIIKNETDSKYIDKAKEAILKITGEDIKAEKDSFKSSESQ